jgi:hypothetical protein
VQAVSSNTAAWENGKGLDRWALDAAGLPNAGASGCVTINGVPVFSPQQQMARNWEYAVFGDQAGYTGATIMLKSFDGCRNSLDALSLYRQLPSRTYAFTLDLALLPVP